MNISQRKLKILYLSLPLILVCISLGCGFSAPFVEPNLGTQPAPTYTPMPTFTPAPLVAAVADNLPDAAVAAPEPATPTPIIILIKPSPSPTPTLSPPPDNSVTIILMQNMNVRAGPGTDYPIIGAGLVGESARVIGRNGDGSWLQVEYANAAGGGWLYAQLLHVNGQPEGVRIVQAPPPPVLPSVTPTPVPPTAIPTPEKRYQFTPAGWHASGNPGIVHFKGRIRDEQGNLVNGFSVLLDNWSWSVLSHPSGASHYYPDKGSGEWDVVIPAKNLKDGLGWWYLTVVRYECPDFDLRFDAQCKQFTRLSEDIKVQVVWPNETVINADWVCHWDCDKGLYKDAYGH